MIDLAKMGVKKWRKQVQNKKKWKQIVQKENNYKFIAKQIYRYIWTNFRQKFSQNSSKLSEHNSVCLL